MQIHDLFIRPLSESSEPGLRRLPVLSDHDHLLRRFGSCEAISLEADATTGLRLRSVSDEIWALMEGSVEFVWHDLRPGSPTRERWDRLVASEPTLVLAPFGVAFGMRGLAERSWLLRIATHADAAPEDAEFPWDTRP